MSIQAAARAPGDGAGAPVADPAARFVEAARTLLYDAGGPSFTVTQVVAAAGGSLKGFYRCFGSKDELLLALFADDSRRGAAALSAMVARRPPDERLRSAVVGLFRFVGGDGRPPHAAALLSEHLRLAQTRPAALRTVVRPYVELFERELAAAAGRGETRAGDVARDARTLFHLVSAHLHALICHQIDDDPTQVADDLWAFCAAALAPTGTRGGTEQ